MSSQYQGPPYDQILPTAFTAITSATIPSFRTDQIVKMVFQQKQTTPSFASATALQTLSSWTTLIAATDATKMVYTPIFSGLVIPPSTPIEVGKDNNETPMGVAEYYNETTSQAKGMFRNVQPTVLLSLKQLTQFSQMNAAGFTNLTAYLINKDGYIFSLANFGGIPIFNFTVGNRGSAGLNSPDINEFRFTLPANWDTTYQVTIPTFDPLASFV